MITNAKLIELADYFKIDRFTILKEYLQLIFLNYLYQEKISSHICFKGGTAIHLLLDSPRFSEDLDFSTNLAREQIIMTIKLIAKKIKKELPEAKISLLYKGRKSVRFKLKYSSVSYKYPQVIKIDFTQKEKLGKILTSPLVTKFPLVVFPIVTHFSKEEILAEKIRALLTRAKGRDIFDLWFLLEKKIKIDLQLVQKKLKPHKITFNLEKLRKKINNFTLKKLALDLSQFLPSPHRKLIPTLKERLVYFIEVEGSSFQG